MVKLGLELMSISSFSVLSITTVIYHITLFFVRLLSSKLFACWAIFHALVLLTFFFKKSFRNTFRLSNSLDPDQDRHFVSPDLGPNCLQRLSVDDKSHHKHGKRFKDLKPFTPYAIFRP